MLDIAIRRYFSKRSQPNCSGQPQPSVHVFTFLKILRQRRGSRTRSCWGCCGHWKKEGNQGPQSPHKADLQGADWPSAPHLPVVGAGAFQISAETFWSRVYPRLVLHRLRKRPPGPWKIGVTPLGGSDPLQVWLPDDAGARSAAPLWTLPLQSLWSLVQ